MGLIDWLVGKKESSKKGPVNDFLMGRTNEISSDDIDEENTKKFQNYEKAMRLKKEGDLASAARILEQSCDPPSIYHGHYRELFKIWRQFNREDMKSRNYRNVSDRVLKMIRYDQEMIRVMLSYWSTQQKKSLPEDYFDKERNLLVSDVQALLKSAEALEEQRNVDLAKDLRKRFFSR